MKIFAGSVRQKWNFWRRGPFCESILENPEGMGGQKKNPFAALQAHFFKESPFGDLQL